MAAVIAPARGSTCIVIGREAVSTSFRRLLRTDLTFGWGEQERNIGSAHAAWTGKVHLSLSGG